jgi:hypothetical protein
MKFCAIKPNAATTSIKRDYSAYENNTNNHEI